LVKSSDKGDHSLLLQLLEDVIVPVASAALAVGKPVNM
jgi:hypothetical protein